MVAYCGIACTTCPAFIATKADDDGKRKEVAEAWSTAEYPLRPEDIDCDGCTTQNGRTISFVRDCTIRNCGRERKIENCAYCTEYACEKLAPCHERSPDAKTTLDNIRQELSRQ